MNEQSVPIAVARKSFMAYNNKPAFLTSGTDRLLAVRILPPEIIVTPLEKRTKTARNSGSLLHPIREGCEYSVACK